MEAINRTPEQQKILDTINELLARREAKKDALREVNRVLRQGFEMAKCFPSRWYVRNPRENVIDYLNKKYNKNISYNEAAQRVLAGIPLGYGEMHGEFAVVPHDVDYSWEITQEEFDYILKLMNQ